MKITIDKIASVTKNVDLKNEVEITSNIKAENGLLIAVEVLEDKKIYNNLELVSGRLSTLKKGDILAVALGDRKALKGFVGKTPKMLKVGNMINVLNIGGVAGLCTSENVKQVGHALKTKVLGAITDGKKPLNVKDFKMFEGENHVESKVPLVVVSGTCMNVGKTRVVCELIKHASDAGLTVFAAKLSGIAAIKDTEKMKDYGAKQAVSFLDAGFTSTVHNNKAVKATKGAITHLSKGNPDFIIIEFGDGVFGEYGVMDILKDPIIQKKIAFHVGCAHDPMGAMKLSEVCKEIGSPLSLISGPVTDNEVGSSFVEKQIGIPAYNTYFNAENLFHYFSKLCLKK
jgi:hypothetical protein